MWSERADDLGRAQPPGDAVARAFKEPEHWLLASMPRSFWAARADKLRIDTPAAGTTVCRAGDHCEALLLLIEGRWIDPQAPGDSVGSVAGICTVTGSPLHESTRVTAADSLVLRIAADVARELSDDALRELVLRQTGRAPLERGTPSVSSNWPAAFETATLAAVLVAAFGAWQLSSMGWSTQAAMVTAGLLPAWLMGQIPRWPRCSGMLLLLLMVSLFGDAEPRGVMLGFSSDAFFWLVGSLVLSMACINCGLAQRLLAGGPTSWSNAEAGQYPSRSLLASARGQLAMFLGSMMVVESSQSRYWLNLTRGGDRAAQGFGGTGNGPLRATGALLLLAAHPVNLLLWGLLPLQSTDRFQPLDWSLHLLPVALLIALLTLRSQPRGPMSSSMALSSYAARPRGLFQGLNPQQQLAAACWVLALLALMTQAVHRIPPGVLLLLCCIGLMALGLVSSQMMWSGLNWDDILTVAGWWGLAGLAAPVLVGVIKPVLLDSFAGLPWAVPCASGLALTAAVSWMLRRATDSLAAAMIGGFMALVLAEALGREPWAWMLTVAAALHLGAGREDGRAGSWTLAAGLAACAAWWVWLGVA